MSDTNRNLTAKTLLLLGELAKAMGPAFEGVGRPLLSTAVGNISDSKSQVRFLIPGAQYSIKFTYHTRPSLTQWVEAIPAHQRLC